MRITFCERWLPYTVNKCTFLSCERQTFLIDHECTSCTEQYRRHPLAPATDMEFWLFLPVPGVGACRWSRGFRGGDSGEHLRPHSYVRQRAALLAQTQTRSRPNGEIQQ